MMITKEEIEETFRKINIPPPKHIYIINNGYITTRPHSRAFKTIVVGMHPVGEQDILLTVASDKKNLIHESIHAMGVNSEILTRILTNIVYLRSEIRLMPPLFSHNIRYVEKPMDKEEVEEYLRSRYLHNINGRDVDLVHLELEE